MLAALGLSNVIMNIFGFSWIWGITGAVNTMSSQDWGAGSYHCIGTTMQRAFVISFFLAAVPVSLVWLNSTVILESMGQVPEVVEHVGIFTRIRIPSLLCQTFQCCVDRTLVSIGNTKISFVTGVVVGIANIGACAVLVPWLHFEGLAIAYVLGDLLYAVVLCTLAFRDADFKRCWPGLTRKAFHGWLPFLRLSVPAFVLLASEGWTWTLQDFFAGYMSASAQAANAIAPNIVVTQYSIGGALSNAATTIVGNSLGEEHADQARRTARLCILMVPLFLTPTTILVLALRWRLPLLFTHDEAVVQMVRELLLITQLYAICDSCQATLTGILYGVGKQAIAAPLIVVCYWIVGLPIRLVLGFGFFGFPAFGMRGLWFGMDVAVILQVLAYGVVVWRIDWDLAVVETKQRQSLGAGDDGLEIELS